MCTYGRRCGDVVDMWPSYRQGDEKPAHMSGDYVIGAGQVSPLPDTQCHHYGIQCLCTKVCTTCARRYREHVRMHTRRATPFAVKSKVIMDITGQPLPVL